MIELYNALKFITMLIFIQKILTFNLGVAFLKSVSIVPTMYVLEQNKLNQRTNGPVNTHLLSGNTSTKTSFAKFDIAVKKVKVDSGSSFIYTL